jgi:zinc protease
MNILRAAASAVLVGVTASAGCQQKASPAGPQAQGSQTAGQAKRPPARGSTAAAKPTAASPVASAAPVATPPRSPDVPPVPAKAAPATKPVQLAAAGGGTPVIDAPATPAPGQSTGPIPTTTPAPAAGPGEMLQATDPMEGYGAESYRVVSRPDEVVAVLKNGVTVVCKRVASPAVSVRGYVYTGGVYEGKWLGGGLSHLLEHLVAGGSNEKRTEEQNRDLLQKIGNDSNAYTTYDHTAYFVNTTTEHLEPAVDLVCNWMLGAKITPAEYRREYDVVQRELEMGKGEPDRVYYYMAASNRYRVNPTRVPVIGYQEVIQGLSRDDVYGYYKLAYVPNNLVFAVAGDVDPEKMLDAVKRQVKGAKPGRDFSRNLPAEPPVLAPRTLVATFPKLGQAKLQLAFPSVRLDDPDVYAIDLLATALGGGESALFTEILRDQKGLVSAVTVQDDTPAYVEGSFQVNLELDPDKVAEATKVVLDTLEQVKQGGVDERRLARAKTQMRAAVVKRMQTVEDVASELATNLMAVGDPHFGERYADRVDAVTPDQVRAVAAKYLDVNRLLTTALLPTEFAPTLPKAQDLLRPTTPAATQPVAATPASDVARVDLGDDTVLLVKRISTSPLVSIQMYALGGLTAEDAATNGLGNLTMQMVARGTKTRSAQQVAEFWDSIGGEFEATCGNNSWSWTANCMKADFQAALEAFADQVTSPTFPDAELPQTKKRVVAQIQGQDADWTNQAFRFFKKTYYGPADSPYQFMAAGTQPNVERFTAEQARDWYAGKVLAGKKVIAVYGDVDPKAAEDLVRKALPVKRPDGAAAAAAGGGPATAPATAGKPPAAAPPAAPAMAGTTAHVDVAQVALNKTEQALAGVVVGYQAETVIGEPATFPLAVGDTMASGYHYPTGYLFEILRGRGLVYVVHAQNSPGLTLRLPGTFLVYAGCEPAKVNEVVDVILENIARLQGTPADTNEDWFRRSKELIVVAEAMENQTPAQQAAQAALDELYGLGYDWHRSFADRVRAVSLDQVRASAAGRLQRCVVTVSTPNPELVTVKAGERRYPTFPKVDLTPRGVQHDTGGK